MPQRRTTPIVETLGLGERFAYHPMWLGVFGLALWRARHEIAPSLTQGAFQFTQIDEDGEVPGPSWPHDTVPINVF